MWPISARVNKPENDDPSILHPFEPVHGGVVDVDLISPLEFVLSAARPEGASVFFSSRKRAAST
jgi:hypothetical protein